jgi:hypothetical protein
MDHNTYIDTHTHTYIRRERERAEVHRLRSELLDCFAEFKTSVDVAKQIESNLVQLGSFARYMGFFFLISDLFFFFKKIFTNPS